MHHPRRIKPSDRAVLNLHGRLWNWSPYVHGEANTDQENDTKMCFEICVLCCKFCQTFSGEVQLKFQYSSKGNAQQQKRRKLFLHCLIFSGIVLCKTGPTQSCSVNLTWLQIAFRTVRALAFTVDSLSATRRPRPAASAWARGGDGGPAGNPRLIPADVTPPPQLPTVTIPTMRGSTLQPEG